jgi:hypothetical protein
MIPQLTPRIWRCALALLLLTFAGHAMCQTTVQELQARVENRMSMRANEGYVQTFPVGRSVLRVPVQMNTTEVLSEVKKWPRPSGRYHTAYKNNKIATLQMFAQLMDNHRNEELVENVVRNVQREAQRFGLNPVDVAVGFIQSYEYIVGTKEHFPVETLARHKGDCSDMSMLLQRMLSLMDVRSHLLVYPNMRHMLLALVLEDGLAQTAPPLYCYVECTTPMAIGAVPTTVQILNNKRKLPIVIPNEEDDDRKFDGFSDISYRDDELSALFGSSFHRKGWQDRVQFEMDWRKEVFGLEDELATTRFQETGEELLLQDTLLADVMHLLDSSMAALERQHARAVKCAKFTWNDECALKWQELRGQFERHEELEMQAAMAKQRHYQAMMAWNVLVAQDTTLWALDNVHARVTYHPPMDSLYVATADLAGLHEVMGRQGLNVAEPTAVDSWPYLGACGTLMGEDQLDCLKSNLYLFLSQNTKLGVLTFKPDEPLVLEFEVSETGDVEHVMVLEAPSDKAGRIFQESMGECPQMTPAMRDGMPVRVALQFKVKPELVSVLQRL